MTYNKKLRCGIFIDGSNLFWGSLNMKPEERWYVDYPKFKKYLKDRYQPLFYKFYGAVDDSPKSPEYQQKALKQKNLYAKLEGIGFDVITKPLKYIKNEKGKWTTKGDMDIELTMGIMALLDDIDTIVLVAGDCDYHPAIQQFHGLGKYIRILSWDDLLSWELRTFARKNPRCSYKTIDSLREKIEYNKGLTIPPAQGKMNL